MCSGIDQPLIPPPFPFFLISDQQGEAWPLVSPLAYHLFGKAFTD